MNQSLIKLIEKYNPKNKTDYENALHEIIQELALAGLWRSKFFETAAFYGETSLRILYGLDRFSEDLDFSLLKPNPSFDLSPYLTAIENELMASGLQIKVEQKVKHPDTKIHSAFLKTNTLETFIRIGLTHQERKTTQINEMIKIKIEVDIDPPPNFSTEIKTLLSPFPFSVRSYIPEDLFAGKLHALLFREYKVRVKGRDWYDFVWYVGRGTHLNLNHLEARMRQSGHWNRASSLTQEEFLKILENKIKHLNIHSAKEDIQSFIKDPKSIAIWSKEFFLSLIPRISFTD
jgi:predicted nucleotidyltransferase component of viral defense system